MASMDQSKHSVEEFEPYSKWKKEDNQDTVEIHLPDFKKEDLKVQVISRLGQLTIKGEHKVDETKSTVFNKTINVPKDCKTDDILAKFYKSTLYVTIKKPSSTQQIQDGIFVIITLIRMCESWLKLGANKGRTSLYVTLVVAIAAYVAKLLQNRLDDCTCVAFKSRYSGFF